MSFQKGLGTGDVRGELVAAHQAHHGLDPGGEVPEVAEEALQVVRVQQLLLAGIGLRQATKGHLECEKQLINNMGC